MAPAAPSAYHRRLWVRLAGGRRCTVDRGRGGGARCWRGRTAANADLRHVDVDMKSWESDGFMAFPGILTPDACERALASLQALQEKNDAVYMETDWNAIDWAQFGLPPLAKPVTAEQQRSLCGGCELSMTPPGSLFPLVGVQRLVPATWKALRRGPGLLPAGAGAERDSSRPVFLWRTTTLLWTWPAIRRCSSCTQAYRLRRDQLRFDHSLLMNRNEARDATTVRGGAEGGGSGTHIRTTKTVLE